MLALFIFGIVFMLVSAPGKVILIILAIISIIMSNQEEKWEPGRGEFEETYNQIHDRIAELKKKGYSDREIKRDAKIDRLERKANRLFYKYGGKKDWLRNKKYTRYKNR